MKFNSLAFSVVAIGLSVFGWTRSAHAAAMACLNDIDCTTGGTACGSDVCTYTATGSPSCTSAGTAAQGMDGWCSADTDCKCHGLGATCNMTYCTFTIPPDAGSAASSGAAGTSGATGTSGAGTSGNSVASGATVSSGAGGTTGAESTSGGETAPAKSSSGCAMAQPTGSSSPWAVGFAVLGACVAFSRRRRA